MSISSREIIKQMKADGWVKVGQAGDHIHFKHPTKPGKATVPHPKKDIPPGTVSAIEKQTGLRLR